MGSFFVNFFIVYCPLFFSWALHKKWTARAEILVHSNSSITEKVLMAAAMEYDPYLDGVMGKVGSH